MFYEILILLKRYFFMKPLFFLFLWNTFMLMNSCNQKSENMLWNGPGKIVLLEDFKSELVQSRNIHIWFPEGYDPERSHGYPVIYMHDGQNLFFPELSYTGITWEVATTLTSLINEEAIEPVIVVGIWNTPLRFQEYMPEDELIGYPEEMKAELAWAESQFPAYHSYHEAYAVIAEELDEFWDIVREKDTERDPVQARKELVQVAVTAWRAARDLGL